MFAKLLEGHDPLCNYEINGHLYTSGYYLVNGSIQDGQYLSKKIFKRLGQMKSHFASCQESCMKDVEQAFGVLQSRFITIWYSSLTWCQDQMWEVMNICGIMHTTIIENERKSSLIDVGLY
jgi:hypothetical protein